MVVTFRPSFSRKWGPYLRASLIFYLGSQMSLESLSPSAIQSDSSFLLLQLRKAQWVAYLIQVSQLLKAGEETPDVVACMQQEWPTYFLSFLFLRKQDLLREVGADLSLSPCFTGSS